MLNDENTPKFTAIFREIYNDVLIESYDTRYADLEGIGMRATAVKAERLLPAVRAQRIKSLVSRHKISGSTQCFIENYGAGGRWKVKARTDHPLVILEGKKLEGSLFSESITPDEGDAVASVKNGRAEFVYISKGAEEAAELCGGRDRLLRMLMPKGLCRKERFVTRETKSGAIITARLSPFSYDGIPFVHIHLSPGGENRIETSHLIASAVTDPQGECICRMNPKMKELLSSGTLTEKALLTSYPFRSSLCQGFARHGMTTDGGFILGAVPEFSVQGLMRMIIFTLECDSFNMMDDSSFGILTPSESKVVRLAAEGRSTKNIGEELNISEGTVKRELFTGCKKLGVGSRIEMIAALYHLR